jgi:hypothetical protein
MNKVFLTQKNMKSLNLFLIVFYSSQILAQSKYQQRDFEVIPFNAKSGDYVRMGAQLQIKSNYWKIVENNSAEQIWSSQGKIIFADSIYFLAFNYANGLYVKKNGLFSPVITGAPGGNRYSLDEKATIRNVYGVSIQGTDGLVEGIMEEHKTGELQFREGSSRKSYYLVKEEKLTELPFSKKYADLKVGFKIIEIPNSTFFIKQEANEFVIYDYNRRESGKKNTQVNYAVIKKIPASGAVLITFERVDGINAGLHRNSFIKIVRGDGQSEYLSIQQYLNQVSFSKSYQRLAFEANEYANFDKQGNRLVQKQFLRDEISHEVIAKRKREIIENHIRYNLEAYSQSNHELIEKENAILAGTYYNPNYIGAKGLITIDKNGEVKILFSKGYYRDEILVGSKSLFEGDVVIERDGVKQRITYSYDTFYDKFGFLHDYQNPTKILIYTKGTSTYDQRKYDVFLNLDLANNTKSVFVDEPSNYLIPKTNNYKTVFLSRLSNNNIVVVKEFEYEYLSNRMMRDMGVGGAGKISRVMTTSKLYKTLVYNESGNKLLSQKVFALPIDTRSEKHIDTKPFRPAKNGFVLLLNSTLECYEIKDFNPEKSYDFMDTGSRGYSIAYFNNDGILTWQKVLRAQKDAKIKEPRVMDYTFFNNSLIVKGVSYQEEVANEPSIVYHVFLNERQADYIEHIDSEKGIQPRDGAIKSILTLESVIYDYRYSEDNHIFKRNVRLEGILKK